ncbi:MAG: SusD/RagB family nutrient-binding outer membrane lipoprotein [Saprospiraceae bacterium]|nr:SusD/RagB family nutrient-binding outer membrane lipoprotein [Saprospiraceae bacterium]
MKFLNRILIVSLLAVMSVGCDDLFELDLLDNPNAVTAENAGVDFLYNNIQLEFRNVYHNMHFIADGLVRHTTMGAFTYVEALPSTTGNGIWNNTYADLFPDVDALVELAESRGLDVHAGTAKLMKAYAMMGLVDMFGDVPFSQALQGTDVISPGVDSGADIYAAAEALIDEAIAQLSGTNAASPAVDNYYGGNVDNWVTLGNTLKLRIGATTRLIGGGSKITAAVSTGDIIDSASEDFQFNYSNNRSNPDSRHPFYPNHYESGDGTYMGNYYMWVMRLEKELDGGPVDPRIRFYFNRQVSTSRDHDVNVYSCILSDEPDPAETPSYYLSVDPNMPYCVASDDGYYGRDHGNGSGIPPDGPIRTLYGLFPGGGKWDNNDFKEGCCQNGGVDGALGEGIAPILTSYMVDFMRAEAAATGATSEDARALLESGVRGSIAKVRTFASKISQAELDHVIATAPQVVTAEVLLTDDDDVEEYVSYVLDQYDNASDKLDVIMKEFYIACAGNSYEVFNFYRRTGKPNNMQPGIDQAIGPFARSLLYPADNVNLNANVSQKPDLQQLVFWDDGSAMLR